MSKEERRKHVRVPYYHTLQYKPQGITNLPEKFLRNADILDISSGGIRIRTISLETNFEVGSILFLNLPMPKMPVTIPTLGKVKWIKLEGVKTRHVGIEFILSA
ncbi:MAG: PilZ domain-containing protein [Thermodesulfovibrionales bacterium]|nr:PilZ domain-containing protein [Thermodesulfovibrionales bacterium]